jgi:hypothetical protein
VLKGAGVRGRAISTLGDVEMLFFSSISSPAGLLARLAVLCKFPELTHFSRSSKNALFCQTASQPGLLHLFESIVSSVGRASERVCDEEHSQSTRCVP